MEVVFCFKRRCLLYNDTFPTGTAIGPPLDTPVGCELCEVADDDDDDDEVDEDDDDGVDEDDDDKDDNDNGDEEEVDEDDVDFKFPYRPRPRPAPLDMASKVLFATSLRDVRINPRCEILGLRRRGFVPIR